MMTYLAFRVILGAVAPLMLGDGRAIAGAIEPDQVAGLGFGVAILVLVATGYWRQYGLNLGASLRALAIWVALGLACIVGYAYRPELQAVADRVAGDLRPGTAANGPAGSVTVIRRQDGEFRVEATVNGQAQTFAFDTGASTVVLTAETASALGIVPRETEFGTPVSTANGTAYAAPTLLDTVSIGTITERRVSALIARPGALRQNLLGQSFLTRLSGYEVRGDRLILRAP